MVSNLPFLLQPKIFHAFPLLVAAESTRLGGVSTAPFESLNLGLSTEDQPKAVERNRKIFFEGLGILPGQVASAFQIHGNNIRKVETAGRWEGYDALISNQKSVFLTVTVADCTPVLIFDPVQEAVAAIHAGWRGTAGQIVRKTLLAMEQEFGTSPRNCLAYIGTCIDECSYEVDADVADHFLGPFKRWDAQKRKFFLDLKKANQAQLTEAGLDSDNIEVSPFSTVLHNDRFFSYRKENGQTGRMLNLIGMKTPLQSS